MPASPETLVSSPRVARQPAASARDVLIFANPTAGRRGGANKPEQLAEQLRLRGYRIHRAGNFDELRKQSHDLHAAGELRATVGIGGDGTAGAALNALPARSPFAMLPSGTENLLAKYLAVPRKPAKAVQHVVDVIESGVTLRLDAGVVRRAGAADRLFILMFSAGFDAEVVRRVDEARTGNINHLSYAKPIVAAMRSYKYPPLHVSWTDVRGDEHEAVGRWLFGVNLPRYARGLPIAPLATGVDGQLDLCLFGRGHTAAGLWYLWNVVRRRHATLASCTTAKCVRFRLAAAEATEDDPSPPYQIDGDPGGVLPVDVEVVPERLSVLTTNAMAAQLGFEITET